jgi:hypothetical protein
LTIVVREIQLRLAAKAWLEQASRRLAESWPFRTIGHSSTVEINATWLDLSVTMIVVPAPGTVLIVPLGKQQGPPANAYGSWMR